MTRKRCVLTKRWAALLGVVAGLGLVIALGGAANGSVASAPSNDNFSAAITLSGQHASRLGDTNVDATLEAGEPTTVAGSPAGTSVWYVWTPPASGHGTIDTATSDFDTLLGVYTGNAVNALTEVASNDQSLHDQTSLVAFAFTAGTTYRIRVDGYAGETGTINLHVNEAPPNDDFANAFTLTGYSANRSGDTNVGASLEPGEVDTVAGSLAGASVWYSWTPPESGSVTIDTATSDFDSLLGVYTGSAVDALTEVASNDDINPPDDRTSSVTFTVTSGTTYRIRVDGYQDAVGTINLHLARVFPPDAPTNVGGTPGAGQVTVTWTAPASDGGSAITGYEITRYVNGVAQGTTSVGVVTQATVTGLTNGTAYMFKVAAKNVAGTGAQSAASNAVTPRTVPDAPTGVAATAGAGQATVSWTAPAFDGGSAITGYEITRYVNGVAQGTTSVGVVTQATITGLTNGVAYTFRVAAKNVAGTGAQSADSNAVMPAVPRVTLTVLKSGTGSGRVTSSAGGINCGSSCTADLDVGSSVTLTATALSGSTFAGWSGACTGTGPCTVTMDLAKSAVAAFNAGLKPASCVVPKLKRKTFATAKRRIAAGHCSTGRVRKGRSKTVPKGRVISQSPPAGKKLPAGSKVNLIVSRGRR